MRSNEQNTLDISSVDVILWNRINNHEEENMSDRNSHPEHIFAQRYPAYKHSVGRGLNKTELERTMQHSRDHIEALTLSTASSVPDPVTRQIKK